MARISSFLCSFREKMGHIVGCRTFWEILDPPLPIVCYVTAHREELSTQSVVFVSSFHCLGSKSKDQSNVTRSSCRATVDEPWLVSSEMTIAKYDQCTQPPTFKVSRQNSNYKVPKRRETNTRCVFCKNGPPLSRHFQLIVSSLSNRKYKPRITCACVVT